MVQSQALKKRRESRAPEFRDLFDAEDGIRSIRRSA
jgi:hypothetical protein